jgi:hypothetical protein
MSLTGHSVQFLSRQGHIIGKKIVAKVFRAPALKPWQA